MDESRAKVFKRKVDEALAVLDYRDPGSLLMATDLLKKAQAEFELRIRRKEQEIAAMKAARNRLADLEMRLRKEADYLRSRLDFEQANETQIRGEAKNPVVPQ